MYFHVIIEDKDEKEYFLLDNEDLAGIKGCIVKPYIEDGDILIDGYFLRRENIKRICIKETNEILDSIIERRRLDKVQQGYFFVKKTKEHYVGEREIGTDITRDVLNDVKASATESGKSQEQIIASRNFTNIFVAHGRDEGATHSVARFIEKLGLKAIILHEQANSGATIIEKFETHADVGYAIVLYTPCDQGGMAGQGKLNSRARQNVVFEHGFLIGKLGRKNVCALVKGDIEKPSDISGIVYINFDEHEGWKTRVAKELKGAGYDINLNYLA